VVALWRSSEVSQCRHCCVIHCFTVYIEYCIQYTCGRFLSGGKSSGPPLCCPDPFLYTITLSIISPEAPLTLSYTCTALEIASRVLLWSKKPANTVVYSECNFSTQGGLLNVIQIHTAHKLYDSFTFYSTGLHSCTSENYQQSILGWKLILHVCKFICSLHGIINAYIHIYTMNVMWYSSNCVLSRHGGVSQRLIMLLLCVSSLGDHVEVPELGTVYPDVPYVPRTGWFSSKYYQQSTVQHTVNLRENNIRRLHVYPLLRKQHKPLVSVLIHRQNVEVKNADGKICRRTNRRLRQKVDGKNIE
jgi:hypothetical protein